MPKCRTTKIPFTHSRNLKFNEKKEKLGLSFLAFVSSTNSVLFWAKMLNALMF